MSIRTIHRCHTVWSIGVALLLVWASIGKAIDAGGTLHVLLWDRFAPGLARAILFALVTIEIVAATLLLLFPRNVAITAGVATLFTVFTVQLIYLGLHRDAPPCACLGVFARDVTSASASAWGGVVRNVTVIVGGVALAFAPRVLPVGLTPSPGHRAVGLSRAGFTVVELLVTLAVIAILMAILLGTVSASRTRAETVACGANLRSIGQALFVYAAESRGWLPRDCVKPGIERTAFFLIADRVLIPGPGDRLTPVGRIFKCTAHPFADRPDVETTYASNAMANFPNEFPAHPLGPYATLRSQVGAIRRASEVVYIGEKSMMLGISEEGEVGPEWGVIVLPQASDIWEARQLPGGADGKDRLTGRRHGRASNHLMFDGSVAELGDADLANPARFDDGLRGHGGGRRVRRIDDYAEFK